VAASGEIASNRANKAKPKPLRPRFRAIEQKQTHCTPAHLSAAGSSLPPGRKRVSEGVSSATPANIGGAPAAGDQRRMCQIERTKPIVHRPSAFEPTAWERSHPRHPNRESAPVCFTSRPRLSDRGGKPAQVVEFLGVGAGWPRNPGSNRKKLLSRSSVHHLESTSEGTYALANEITANAPVPLQPPRLSPSGFHA
jgi:hypothetical protein